MGILSNEVFVFSHGSEIASKLVGSTPHDELLIRTSNSVKPSVESCVEVRWRFDLVMMAADPSICKVDLKGEAVAATMEEAASTAEVK
ncbi:hypothetical protein ACSBR1_026107 [Camellia fascicularis]